MGQYSGRVSVSAGAELGDMLGAVHVAVISIFWKGDTPGTA